MDGGWKRREKQYLKIMDGGNKRKSSITTEILKTVGDGNKILKEQ